MDDAKRTVVAGLAVVVRGNDIDTDRIIPARFLRCVTFDGLGDQAFKDDREHARAEGREHPFDGPVHARLLFVNKNFGCGSSREHAPQALMRWRGGIGAVVGESFAEIFRGNCLILGIPCATVDHATMGRLMDLAEAQPALEFRLDVVRLELTGGDLTCPVAIPPGARQQLLEGRWDSAGELLAAKEDIARTAERLPYFRHWA